MPHSPNVDRNLLFGILALQMNFISRDGLIAGMNAWVLEKHKSLGHILVEKKQLTLEQLSALDALIVQHIKAHKDDPEQSLQALAGQSSVLPLDAPTGDPDVDASLTRLGGQSRFEPTIDFSHLQADTGRFKKLRPYARGGLGQIFVAEDTELHREVALKEINQDLADNASSRGRFMLEAEITGALEHPGIVPVYGLGVYPDGRPFYAMRLVHGINFREAIERFHAADKQPRDPGERSLDFRQLLGRFNDVCNAIAYAHSRGVLHRDIKPSNIMLGKFGETLLVDWGLAKVMHKPAGATPAGDWTAESLVHPTPGSGSQPTRAGVTVGTPGYMSPEQAAGRISELNSASDIFGLGATLYFLLTGRAPFAGASDGEVLSQTQEGQYVSPRQLKPDTPRALEAICHKAMAPAPTARYASAIDLAADIEHWLGDEPVAAFKDPWTARAGRWARRHRAAVVGAAVFLVSAVAALSISTVIVVAEQNKTAEQEQLARKNQDLASDLKKVVDRNKALTRDLSNAGIDLIESSEADFTSVSTSNVARMELLKSVSHAIRDFLDQDPDNLELRWRTAQVFRYTANVYRLINDTQAAEPLYRESISLYSGLQHINPGDAKPREGRAETLRDWSQLKAQLGQLREATENLNEVLKLIDSLQDTHGKKPHYSRMKATVLLDLSGIELARNVVDDSKNTADQAVKEFRALAEMTPEHAHPYDPLLLAASLNLAAVGERHRNKNQAAIPLHKEAVILLENMRKAKPARVSVVDILHFLARCRLEQCRTWAMSNDPKSLANAETNLGNAIVQWEELAKIDSRLSIYRAFQATAYQTRGQLRANDDRTNEAWDDFVQAQTRLEELTRLNPQAYSHHGDLGRTYLSLGRLAQSKNDKAKAMDLLSKAQAALQKAMQHSPDATLNRQTLEEVNAALGKLRQG